MPRARLVLGLLGACLGLLALPLPAPVATAHWCHTTFTEYGQDPLDPDQGCNGADCVGGGYHHHKNDIPPKACHSGRCRPFEYKCCRQHPNPHSHMYGGGGRAGASSDTVTGGEDVGFGKVLVFDADAGRCNGRVDENLESDYDSGVGGAFFGYGPYADEPVCNYGLQTHGNTIQGVQDFAFGSDIWFVLGADDTGGPVVTTDPDTGETSCETDGRITPGDPATDPTADADDCLTSPMNIAQGVGTPYATCGAGGDGGYWAFLIDLFLSEWGGGVTFGNVPTTGLITA